MTGKRDLKLVRMVGRRCCKVGRRRRVQDAGGEWGIREQIERRGGRQRKRGSQVRVSDSDRRLTTQDISLNTRTHASLLRKPQREYVSAALLNRSCTLFLFFSFSLSWIYSFPPASCFALHLNGKLHLSRTADSPQRDKWLSKSLITRTCATLCRLEIRKCLFPFTLELILSSGGNRTTAHFMPVEQVSGLFLSGLYSFWGTWGLEHAHLGICSLLGEKQDIRFR